jgi:monoamine oxidase
VSPHVDVVVVGAGMAGLVCAHRLRQRGVEVLVLEAGAEPGGRTAGTTVDGATVDLGGQFIGPGQDRVYALAAEFGVATFPTYTAGAHLLETGTGLPRRFRGMVPKLDPLTLLDVGQAQYRLDRLARAIDPDRPWHGPNAATLDGQTLRSWIDRTARTRAGRRFLVLACQAIWSCEPSELSLLHALFYIRSAGNLAALTDFEGGAQQDRLEGGAYGLAGRLAASLGTALRLNAPVRRVEHDDAGVTVTVDGTGWRAGYAVVAVAPPLAARITYDPPLPAARVNLLQRLPMGSVLKCVATYPEPFWRSAGLSGAAISLSGPIALTADSSPRSGDRGVLVAFVNGATARDLATTPRPTGGPRCSTRWAGCSAHRPANPWPSSSGTGTPNRSRAARTRRCSHPVPGPSWGPPSVLPSVEFTGRARRPHPAGTATSRARSARARPRRTRSPRSCVPSSRGDPGARQAAAAPHWSQRRRRGRPANGEAVMFAWWRRWRKSVKRRKAAARRKSGRRDRRFGWDPRYGDPSDGDL